LSFLPVAVEVDAMTRFAGVPVIAVALLLGGSAGCNSNKKVISEESPAGRGDKNASPAVAYKDEAVLETEKRAPSELQGGKDKEQPAPVERRIIFTAEARLTVSDFPKAEHELQQLVQQTPKAFFSQSDVTGAAGGSRTGTWKIRLPVVAFTAFREAVRKLGDLESYSSTGQDVTEEFYDLLARMKNKEAELEVLRKLFDKAGSIADIVTVQREVSRAQGELEQMKGRKQVLENRTCLP
jgi:hypothetical protein